MHILTYINMAKSWQAEKVNMYNAIVNIVDAADGKKIPQSDLIAEVEVSVGYSFDTIERMLGNLYATKRLYLDKNGVVSTCKP